MMSTSIALDVRSLVVFRICLGVYLLYDIWIVRLPTSLLSMIRSAMLAAGIDGDSVVDYNVGWYTSSSESATYTTSYLQKYDTPHQSPIHQVWFYRGSTAYQYALFIVTSSMAIAYTFGMFEEVKYIRRGNDIHQPTSQPQRDKNQHPIEITIAVRSILCKLCLWLLVTSYQNQNMYVHDGSDNYTRLLLLYSCFIPLGSFGTDRQGKCDNRCVRSISIVSISLQIVIMYVGTVSRRTIDILDTVPMSQNEWLPPTLSAVSNALCYNNFAVRNHFLNHIICSNYLLSQVMTMCAMIIETCCPIVGFGMLLLISNQCRNRREQMNVQRYQRILWYASILPIMTLHIGLLCSLRLPNWQIIAVIALILWIPTSIWDRIAHQWHKVMTSSCINFLTQNECNHSSNEYKKTDGDNVHHMTIATTENDTGANVETKQSNLYTIQSPSMIVTIVQYFLFIHMIYNFCNERSIIPKYDSGDIGEFLRISQYWVMYGTVGSASHTTRITGSVNIDTSSFHPSIEFKNATSIAKKLDVLHFISTGRMSDPMSLFTADTHDIPHNVSTAMIAAEPHLTTYYPNVRWERALHTLSKDSFMYRSTGNARRNQQQKERLHYFGNSLCRLINDDLRQVSQKTSNNTRLRTSLFRWLPLFDMLQQKYHRNMVWLMNTTEGTTSGATNDNVQRQQSHTINVSEIEIRFQHLQLLSKQHALRKLSSDFVITVPCRLD